ncbi:MAG TPA: hypothetical protein VLH40_09590, partial [Atribacteraceae bacterium]|nr:hypothetical protein [Atribacteraceae bacterium]
SQTADENREILKHLTQRSPRIAFNVDLIYGLPFQSLLEWQKDLEEALEFHPAHLSIYNLTLHPMVPIARFSRSHPAVFPDPEREALMFQWTMDRLSDAGYIHYEISNFAFPGHEARHNLAYWRNDNTLGLGLGAWSFLDGVRERNAKHFCHYLAMIENNLNPAVFRERLMPEQGARETFFLALRTNRGADLNLILESTAGDPSILWRKAENLQSGGFINIAGSMIFLTRKGILVANQVIQELID